MSILQAKLVNKRKKKEKKKIFQRIFCSSIWENTQHPGSKIKLRLVPLIYYYVNKIA